MLRVNGFNEVLRVNSLDLLNGICFSFPFSMVSLAGTEKLSEFEKRFTVPLEKLSRFFDIREEIDFFNQEMLGQENISLSGNLEPSLKELEIFQEITADTTPCLIVDPYNIDTLILPECASKLKVNPSFDDALPPYIIRDVKDLYNLFPTFKKRSLNLLYNTMCMSLKKAGNSLPEIYSANLLDKRTKRWINLSVSYMKPMSRLDLKNKLSFIKTLFDNIDYCFAHSNI